MQLPDVDDETFGALLQLLEGIENRRPQPQLGLPYHQEKLLADLAQKLRFELAARKMPSDIPVALPMGVASSVPPVFDEPKVFIHWDSVLEKIDSASKAFVGCAWRSDAESGLQRVFYDISLRQHKLDPSYPDLSVHVEPYFKYTEGTGTLVFRLRPKTTMGRRYIVSRQPQPAEAK